MIIKRIVQSILFLILCTNINAQKSYSFYTSKVLKENKTKKEHHYITSDSVDLYITLLGEVAATGNKKYKLVTIKSIIPSHGYGYLLVYDSTNKYLGRYRLGPVWNLPIGFKNGYLYFSNREKSCKTRTVSKISFKKNIPKKIFIPECEGSGDVIDFRTDQ